MFFKLSKFFLHSTAFTVAIVSTSTLFPFIVGKYTFFRMTVELALLFFILGLMLDFEGGKYWARLKQLFKNPLVWALTAFVFLFVLSGIMGIRPSMSFWSNFERGEGGFQMLHLYFYVLLLATLFREIKDWKKYFIFTLISAGLMVTYGVFAGAKFIGMERNAQGMVGEANGWYNTFRNFVGPSFTDSGYRFHGSIGNPAYVAAYLMFAMFYSAMLAFFMERKRRNKILVGVAVLAFAIVFYFSGTRGAFLGLLSGLGVGAVYLAIAQKSWRKWILPIGGVVAATVISLVAFQDTEFVKGIPGSRIFDISFKEQLTSDDQGTFSTRTVMWGIAVDAWKDRPLLGYGTENFIWVFDRYFDPRYYNPVQGFGAWFDRAHSIFFDQLVSGGILGLGAFISIFAVLAWTIFKKPLRHIGGDAPWKAHLTKALMFALPTAYLVQGLALFDVLTIHIGIFGFFAFALFMTVHEPENKNFTPDAKFYGGAIIGLAGIFFGLFYGTLLPYAKAVRYIDAEANSSTIQSVAQFEDNFNRVLKFNSPVGDEEIPKFLGGNILEIVSRATNDRPTALALVKYIEPYFTDDNVRHLLLLGQMYGSLWQNYEYAEDFEKAEDAFMRAREVGPTLPHPMMGLMMLYEGAGDEEKLKEIKDRYNSLWPTASTSTQN